MGLTIGGLRLLSMSAGRTPSEYMKPLKDPHHLSPGRMEVFQIARDESGDQITRSKRAEAMVGRR